MWSQRFAEISSGSSSLLPSWWILRQEFFRRIRRLRNYMVTNYMDYMDSSWFWIIILDKIWWSSMSSPFLTDKSPFNCGHNIYIIMDHHQFIFLSQIYCRLGCMHWGEPDGHVAMRFSIYHTVPCNFIVTFLLLLGRFGFCSFSESTEFFGNTYCLMHTSEPNFILRH